jgi:hypothetical protein
VTDPDPEPPADAGTAGEPGDAAAETQEQKRARIMARLGELIRADPPDLSASGPVSAGAFPAIPGSADEFDQQAAEELFAALGQFFDLRKKRPGDAGDQGEAQDLEKE